MMAGGSPFTGACFPNGFLKTINTEINSDVLHMIFWEHPGLGSGEEAREGGMK